MIWIVLYFIIGAGFALGAVASVYEDSDGVLVPALCGLTLVFVWLGYLLWKTWSSIIRKIQ